MNRTRRGIGWIGMGMLAVTLALAADPPASVPAGFDRPLVIDRHLERKLAALEEKVAALEEAIALINAHIAQLQAAAKAP